jgi:hypothetical protein
MPALAYFGQTLEKPKDRCQSEQLIASQTPFPMAIQANWPVSQNLERELLVFNVPLFPGAR